MIHFLLQDPQPWFSAEAANYFGAFAGAGIGVLGGLFGAMCGILVPKGKGRAIILPAMLLFAVCGLGLLAVGLIALFKGQPYVIYYPFLLIGFLLACLFGTLYPVLRKRYAAAEQRQIEADALRRS